MLSISDEQRALLKLTLVNGLGPRLIRSLLERFGSAEKAVQASVHELSQVPYISDRLAIDFRQALDHLNVDGEIERMGKHDVRPVFLGDEEYPQALAKVPVSPLLLYIRGTLIPSDNNAIAIVGSRQCTAYGRRMAERLAGDLARAGWTIVSGLARGIDGCAHQGALQAGGRTIAVLASGLNTIYPPEHKDLSVQVQNSGALLTEYNMQMEPLPVLFPMRNRIISGLSRAVVVIEANKQSGALITTKHAAEQGREVFALPGPVDSSASAGTLELLRNGARLIRSADDILEDLKGISPLIPSQEKSSRQEQASEEPNLFQQKSPEGMDETQRRIWDFLSGPPRYQDEMAQELEMNISQLSSTLLMMEMKKIIRRLPGNRFERF